MLESAWATESVKGWGSEKEKGWGSEKEKVTDWEPG